MKTILYLSNIKVPYRVRFFIELAKKCDLTVLFEREESSNRNRGWTESEEVRFRTEYLGGLKVGDENVFSLRILKYILAGYDSVIVGCYNSPVQMLAILVMRLLRIPFFINLDGEVFLERKDIKTAIKRFFLKGAKGYFVAGERAAQTLKCIADAEIIHVYHFSSLNEAELRENSSHNTERGKDILVVGQYFDYKGLDVMVAVARKDQSRHYKFVGMSDRAELFVQEQGVNELPSVEVIPFMQKAELIEEYKKCAMMVLPSRQECWGLVINEAASFGTPIVSTWGSGAAVEYLAECYPQYLAQPGDVESLYAAIKLLERDKNVAEYSRYLIERSGAYSIEKSVKQHLKALKIEESA